MSKNAGFMPVCAADLKERGIKQLDFVYVLGDAYIDHPSFGAAIIGRVLEHNGYTVGILSQPDYKNPDSLLALGVPRLAFLVSSGNMDSMVNIYTAGRRMRRDDMFSENGQQIKEGSQFKSTFIATCANNMLYYVPSEATYAYEAYEIDTGRLAKGSAEILVAEYIRMLGQLYETK